MLKLISSKKRCGSVFISIAVLCCGYGVAAAQEFRNVRDGIEYTEVTRTIDGASVRMNLLRLDLSKVRLDVVHAETGVIGTETTSSIAKRNNAIAAVNAGFFRLDQSSFAGDPAGIFQIDGKLLSESNNNRIALLIDNRADEAKRASSRVSIMHLRTFGEFWSREYRFNISGIDREMKNNDAVLYTPEFGLATPQLNSKALEIVIENKRVREIRDSNGGSPIPPEGFVLAAVGSRRAELTSMVKAGSEAIVILGAFADKGSDPTFTGRMAFIDTEDIVGGVPQLINNGKIDVTWEREKTTKPFVETRHPRTAVAILKDGRFLMVTVDGRSESSGGISLHDLAQWLLELGAVEAMNLDGGGSTTMYLDGQVVNRPSDKEGERKVSDALIVTPRNTPSKAPIKRKALLR